MVKRSHFSFETIWLYLWFLNLVPFFKFWGFWCGVRAAKNIFQYNNSFSPFFLALNYTVLFTFFLPSTVNTKPGPSFSMMLGVYQHICFAITQITNHRHLVTVFSILNLAGIFIFYYSQIYIHFYILQDNQYKIIHIVSLPLALGRLLVFSIYRGTIEEHYISHVLQLVSPSIHFKMSFIPLEFLEIKINFLLSNSNTGLEFFSPL